MSKLLIGWQMKSCKVTVFFTRPKLKANGQGQWIALKLGDFEMAEGQEGKGTFFPYSGHTVVSGQIDHRRPNWRCALRDRCVKVMFHWRMRIKNLPKFRWAKYRVCIFRKENSPDFDSEINQLPLMRGKLKNVPRDTLTMVNSMMWWRI